MKSAKLKLTLEKGGSFVRGGGKSGSLFLLSVGVGLRFLYANIILLIIYNL